MPTNCSVCSNGCTRPASSRAPASAWRMCDASSIATAAGSGLKARWTAARHFIFRFQPGQRRGHMTTQKWILLAEDNPHDADLVMRALAASQMHETVVVAND